MGWKLNNYNQYERALIEKLNEILKKMRRGEALTEKDNLVRTQASCSVQVTSEYVGQYKLYEQNQCEQGVCR